MHTSAPDRSVPLQTESLRAPTLWITVSRSTYGGKRCRDYAVCDVDGAALLTARAFVWGREFTVREPVSASALLWLRRRLAFPVTGRVDVLAAGGQLLGAVYRNGRFANGAGATVGRFRDARRLRARAGESVLVGIAEAVLGGEGSSTLSGPTAYLCMVGDQPAGTLALRRLPWPRPEPREAPAALAAVTRLLPNRVRQAIGGLRAPSGWRYERNGALLEAEPLLTLGAALFQIELSQW